jgi:predicted DNA-binding transcriptional regulator AlpA
MTTQKIIRPREACEQLGIGMSTLYHWIATGIIAPPLKLSDEPNGAVGWPDDEFDALIERRRAERDARILKKVGNREPQTDAERGAVARELVRKVAQSKTGEH